MLYKKIHRQYLREFREGRKYRYEDVERVVAKKPYIDGKYIQIIYVKDGCRFCSVQILISIENLFLGELLSKSDITWLED